MYIRSLPKHGGELSVFLQSLETKFDVILLTEVGARNIGTVEHLLPNYDFYYTLPRENFYGGVGMYVSKSIGSIQTIDDLNFTQTCQCSKCAVQTLYIRFDYGKRSYILGGKYRHPNGNIKHFTEDLENTLTTITKKCTAFFVGDLNIDLIKYENSDNALYMFTLMSYGYLPYVTIPTRIKDFSVTCIDHIFIRDRNNSHRHKEVTYGIFYCDIADHLPCLVTLKRQSNYVLDRPLTRLFGETNTSKFRELMTNENWDIIFIEGTDWYTNFIKLVCNKFEA